MPAELSGPYYGLKKIICEEGGYDLTVCAGKNTLVTSFPLKEELYSGEPLNLWVVTCEERIACVYKTVREGSDLVPGIFSVENRIEKE